MREIERALRIIERNGFAGMRFAVHGDHLTVVVMAEHADCTGHISDHVRDAADGLHEFENVHG